LRVRRVSEMDTTDLPSATSRTDGVSGALLARSIILIVACVWFLALALPATQGDPASGIYDFLRGLAGALALLALAHVDWSAFRGMFGTD
jgi:hypothetical protein